MCLLSPAQSVMHTCPTTNAALPDGLDGGGSDAGGARRKERGDDGGVGCCCVEWSSPTSCTRGEVVAWLAAVAWGPAWFAVAGSATKFTRAGGQRRGVWPQTARPRQGYCNWSRVLLQPLRLSQKIPQISSADCAARCSDHNEVLAQFRHRSPREYPVDRLTHMDLLPESTHLREVHLTIVTPSVPHYGL